MNGIAISFLLFNGIALIAFPRRWAPLPLLAGASYITLSQAINVGPLTFSVLRLLILAGVVRVIMRGERSALYPLNALDWLMFAWSAATIFSSLFHNNVSSAFIYRLGFVYDAGGIYLLFREMWF